jgi:hypothetical protein
MLFQFAIVYNILSFVSSLRSGTLGPGLQAALKNWDVDLRSFSSAVRSASHIGVTTRASKYYNINRIWKVITIIGLDYIRLHTTTDQSIQTFQKIEGKVSKTAKHNSPLKNSTQKSGNCDGHS